ncbi:MAG: hypothetical protein WCG86_03325 [Actinomycetota bacterium]|jgi:hypothetical protein
MAKRPFNPDRDVAEWHGASQPYDLLREGFVALIAVAILITSLALLFGSPDEKSVTIRSWARADATDFVTTALGELSGATTSAGYGAPYNHASDGPALGPLHIQRMAGVTIAVDSIQDFVIAPLDSLAAGRSASLTAALLRWHAATSPQRLLWANATVVGALGVSSAPAGDPVPELLSSLSAMATSGALDQSLIAGRGFFSMDYTKPLLFIADGNWFTTLADRQNLLGTQWGMMNETGSYPGQAWLWLYTFWYQIAPFNSSGNADVLVFATMIFLSGLLIFLPFLPGLRSLPRWSKVYRLIWREHYRRTGEASRPRI